jgi:hypothetical protein
MFLNYSTTNKFTNLYHLVLIGEEGAGQIQFMLKTQFGNETLSPIIAPKAVFAGNETKLSFASIFNNLEQANFFYTTNNWTTQTTTSMTIANDTCSITIPGQEAGSFVQYRIEATDSLRNILQASGNYTVKMKANLDFSLINKEIRLGENITVNGLLSPVTNVSAVRLDVFGKNYNDSLTCKIYSNGTFGASFKPPNSGDYYITATALETPTSYLANGPEVTFSVAEPALYIKYSIPIIGVIVAASVVGGLLYFFRFRGR